jgi:FKBP-type peptidyl-prolyl cis-trans isomerase
MSFFTTGMKTLEQKEWIAVFLALFVVGFVIMYGSGLSSFFSNTNSTNIAANTPKVMIQDVVVGTGETAMPGSKVFVNYVGHFVDGTVFDSNLEQSEAFPFILGAGQVIKGWDEGIVGMKVGGKRILTVPPELGYGAEDYLQIPGNSTLIFEVELVKVN